MQYDLLGINKSTLLEIHNKFKIGLKVFHTKLASIINNHIITLFHLFNNLSYNFISPSKRYPSKFHLPTLVSPTPTYAHLDDTLLTEAHPIIV